MKKISFIIYYPYQWFIYRNIYRLIPEDKREVILDLSVHKNLQKEEVQENIKKLLTRENVGFRTLTSLDYIHIEHFKDFFSNVEVIVSCWESGCVENAHLAGIKKVGLTYGLAKELNMVRPARAFYDIVLAYGKRDQAYFSLLTKSVAIGNPRLDSFYSGEKQFSKEIRTLREFVDPRKKTVLYVPTHGDLGSFKEMSSTFADLSKKYNIIFKPHYYSLREDSEIIEQYRRIKDILVIDDTWDTIEVMAEADIIVSDNSSAIFDAMQVDKPIIVCDFLTDEFLDIVHKNLRFTKRGIVGANTYSASIEQEIKAKGLVLTIKKPKELEYVLDDIENLDKRYRESQRSLVREFFAYLDGNASKRASEIILDIYKKPREHVPGILHHAYLAHDNRLYQALGQKQLRASESKEKGDVILWIFCDGKIKKNTILNALHQSFNQENIRQIIVSGYSEEVFPGVSSNVAFFSNHSDALSQAYGGCKHNDELLFVKATTAVTELHTAIGFKNVSKRSVLFFAENKTSLAGPGGVAFRLLKHEIVGFTPLSEDAFISVGQNQLQSLEMAGVLISTSELLEHEMPQPETFSFNYMMSFFIMLDSLQSTDFALMPNIFGSYEDCEDKELFARMVKKGAYLEQAHIPIRKWPDNKIGFYLYKMISGRFEYHHLLRLVISKIFSALKQRLLASLHVEYLIKKRGGVQQ